MKATNLILAAFGFCLAAAPAYAAEFTFEVPVEISGVPSEVSHATVSCAAVQLSNTSNLAVSAAETITNFMGMAIPLTNGAYRGTLRIEANAQPGRRPHEANGYECFLSVFTVRDGPTFAINASRLLQFFPPAPGTTPVLNMRGLFPAARQ